MKIKEKIRSKLKDKNETNLTSPSVEKIVHNKENDKMELDEVKQDKEKEEKEKSKEKKKKT